MTNQPTSIQEQRKILIIDDDSAVSTFLATHLARQFYVVIANRGRDALKIASEERFDLFLIDVLLPDMSIDEVMSGLRAHYPVGVTPAIVMSALFYKSRNVRSLLEQWQADAFIPKPIDLSDLDEKLSRLLSGHDAIGSDVPGFENLRKRYLHELQSMIFMMQSEIARLEGPETSEALAQIRSVAHRIHGSAGSYGFPEISSRAANLEILAEKAKTDTNSVSPFVLKKIQRLYQKLERTVRETSILARISEKEAKGQTVILHVGPGSRLQNELALESRKRGYEFQTRQYIDDVHALTLTSSPDAIFVDLDEKSGLDFSFVSQLKRGLAEQKSTIACVGVDTSENRIQAANAGASLFFSKDAIASTMISETVHRGAPEEEEVSILVVDDDPIMLHFFKACFLRTHYQIFGTTDPKEVLSNARAQRPALIVMDLEMPEIQGYDLCRALKTDPELARIPVVAYTAKVTDAIRIRALKAGAVDVIEKTGSLHELKLKIRSLLHSTEVSRSKALGPSNEQRRNV